MGHLVSKVRSGLRPIDAAGRMAPRTNKDMFHAYPESWGDVQLQWRLFDATICTSQVVIGLL